MNKTLFYQDKPLFGMDIGSDSIKVMQIELHHNQRRVVGYGANTFDASALKDGVIVDYNKVAEAANDLFKKHLQGDITTSRVVMAVPASRTFSRTFTIPRVDKKDLAEAVRLEIEQYIPVPADELYFDHMVLEETPKDMEILSVATPRKIVDSFMRLAEILGLEVAVMDTTTEATGRLFVKSERSDLPTVLIDLGSVSSDLTIYDKTLVVTGTVPGGGESFTSAISTKLGVSDKEAHVVKTKYGLGLSKKQAEITEVLTPILGQMLKEIKQMIRYYDERSGSKETVAQIVTMGGGANMPGLADYMTNALRLPVRMCDPWQHLKFSGPKPNPLEKSMYVTVAGLAYVTPKEITNA